MGERDLLASMTMDQNFPGKETHCGPFFYISIAQWSVEKDDTIMGKVAKAKEKPAAKMGKQRIDRQFSKLRFIGVVNVLVSRLLLAINKRKLRLQHHV